MPNFFVQPLSISDSKLFNTPENGRIGILDLTLRPQPLWKEDLEIYCYYFTFATTLDFILIQDKEHTIYWSIYREMIKIFQTCKAKKFQGDS